MSTKFLSPGWRMPRNANQSKQSNYSMDFNGSQHIDLGNLDFLNTATALTVSFWFKADDALDSNWHTFLANGSLNPVSNLWCGLTRSNWSSVVDGTSIQPTFSLKINGVNSIVGGWGGNITTASPNPLVNGTWYHFCGTWDGSTQKLYIDGQLKGSLSTTGSIDTTTNDTYIGASPNPTSYLFDGSIDAVSIFNYALSPSQVTTLWGGGTSVSNPMAIPRTPIAYYPLGTSAYNGEYLAENNAIGDYVFDGYPGSTKLINSNINQSNTGGKFTISFWQKFNGSGLVTFNHGGGTIGEFKYFSQPIVYLASNYFQYFNIAYSTLIANTNWQHFVVFVDTTNVTNSKLWIDKTPIATAGSSTGGPANSFTSGLQLNLGAYPKISNMMYFTNYEIDQANVDKLYNYGSPLMSTATLTQAPNAWYKLDASEVYNSSTTEWEINNALSPWTSSLSFGNTATSHVALGLNSTLPTTSITLSLWVRSVDNSQNYKPIFLTKSSISGQDASIYILAFSTGSVGIKIMTDAGFKQNFTVPAGLNDNKWHHISVTYDGANIAYYTDGDLYTTELLSGTISYDTTTYPRPFIGANPSATSSYFKGEVSNVQIFNTALPAIGSNSVETLYNNGSPLTDMSSFTSLLNWYKLDNLTTGIEDSKGTQDGTNSGAIEAVGSVSTLNGDSSGMSQSNLVQSDLQTVAPYSKYAMNFDGTDYIETSGPNFTTAFSFSCWFKTSNTGTQTIWTASQSSTQKHFLRISGTQFRLRLADSNNPSGLISLDNTLTTADGNWHHVCFTTDGLTTTDGIIVYFDGYPLPVKATLANAGFVSTDSNYLGTYSSGGTWAFNGSLSNASFWNTALTSTQVTEIYNEGIPSDLNSHSAYSNLVSWWQLGENSSYVGGATNPWTFADEKGTNNGLSPNLPEIALTNGVGTTANGVSTGMSEGNLVGDAPYSTANALSSGMAVTAKGTDVP